MLLESVWAQVLTAMGLAAVATAGMWWFGQRRRVAEGGTIDVGAWRGWADASGYDFTGNDSRAVITGAAHDVPFRFSCEIQTIKVQTRGVSREHKIAKTHLRVAMRTDLPTDLFIHPMPRMGRWLNRLLGGKTIETIPAIDDLMAVETSEADKAREVLLHADVLPHLARLLQLLPEAMIDARSVEASFNGMPTLAMALDRYVDTLAAFVLAVQKVAPGHAIEAPALATADSEEPVQIMTSAQLPKRRPILAHALAKVQRDAGESPSLYVQPFEYEVRVTHSKEAFDERERPTGGRAAVGEVARSVWKIELLFAPEDNEAVDALAPGSFIAGMCEILQVDLRRKRVLARSATPPMPAIDPPQS